MTSILSHLWMIELFNQVKENIMDMLQILVALAVGSAGTIGWQRYVWPAIARKRAVKARIAKAMATRRANAVRKASGGEQ